MLLLRGDEEGPDVTMVCVSINTECHRTCLGDVLALLAPGALPEKCMANISASLRKHLDYILEPET